MSNLFQSHHEPLSPSSPPETGYKQQENQITRSKTPASPISPPHMSVATKSYVSSYENNRHADEMAQRPPRSPNTGYLNSTQRADTSQNETPNSLKRSYQEDGNDWPQNKRQRKEGPHDEMDVDNQISSTNHERQESTQPKVEDTGDTIKSEQIESQRIGDISLAKSQGLNEEHTGPAFLICKSPHHRSQPDSNQHLMGIYGLSSLLQTVARTHPTNGEKINKLRKSYEGQVKSFALPGRIKPYREPREEDQPGKLRILATLPESEWEKQSGSTKIEVTDSLKLKLQQALQLNPGTMSKSINIEWEDVLGHEKPKPTVTTVQSPVSSQPKIVNGVRPQYATGSTIDKMKTRGKKRSYDDSSFYGYAEGYSDEEHSDRDSERRKKRRE